MTDEAGFQSIPESRGTGRDHSSESEEGDMNLGKDIKNGDSR